MQPISDEALAALDAQRACIPDDWADRENEEEYFGLAQLHTDFGDSVFGEYPALRERLRQAEARNADLRKIAYGFACWAEAASLPVGGGAVPGSVIAEPGKRGA